jgi:hypothetical protein
VRYTQGSSIPARKHVLLLAQRHILKTASKRLLKCAFGRNRTYIKALEELCSIH